MGKTYGSTGWYFKSGGGKSRSKLKRFSSGRVKVSGSTDTPRAKHNVKEKIVHTDDEGVFKGLGASVLYREHAKEVQYVEWQIMQEVTGRFTPKEHVTHFRPEWLRFYLVRISNYELFCMFSGNRAFFVEVDHVLLTQRFSTEYTTDRARQLTRVGDPRKEIMWIKKLKLPNTPPANPP